MAQLTLLPQPRSVTLQDGTRACLRALVPEDRPLVADVFDGLSDHSRYMRFLTPMPSLPRRTLHALTDVDHDRHLALVAVQGGRALGVARYVRFGDADEADFAVSVVDATQGRGLGRALLEALLDVAAARGIRALTFDIHPENRPMLHLVASLGAATALRDGTVSGRLETAPARLPLAA